MINCLNRQIIGTGGGGASASIYVTGLSQTDSVTMTTPSGGTVQGVWKEVQGENCFVFYANEYRLHTITASNGVKTSTEEVLVDALMDYWVEMDLTKLYLYKYGDERESITGGWSDGWAYGGGGTFTKNIDNISVYSGQGQHAQGVATNHTTNVNGYKRLYLEVDPHNDTTNDWHFFFYATNSRDVWDEINKCGHASMRAPSDNICRNLFVNLPTKQYSTVYYDLTGLTGNKYVGFASYGGLIWNVRAVWLE